MNFDQDAFITLLKTAIGHRTQKEFASEASISIGHLSRMLKKHYDTAPTPRSLQLIAAAADNGVTYEDLAKACGYILPSPINPGIYASDFKHAQATILTALSATKIPWSNTPDIKGELCIALTDGIIKKWHFLFLNTLTKEHIPLQIALICKDLLYRQADGADKYSLVTESGVFYQTISNRPLRNLNLNLSVILVDSQSLELRSEQWISQTIASDNSIKQLTF